MPTKFRFAIVSLFILGLIPTAWTQDAKHDAIIERMKKDVFFLASEECEGRGVGTLGLDLAAQYIAVQFKHAGLKPGGVNGTYFQPFPFCTNSKLDGESSMTIIGKDGKDRALKQGEDFQVLGSSAPCALTAPVVFVGYGVTAKSIAYDDYAGVDVKGKIVIALRRVPRWNDKDKPFDGVHKEEVASLDFKQYRAQANKAAAIILVNDATEAKDALVPFAQMANSLTTTTMPYVHVKRDAINDLLKDSLGKSLADIEKAIDVDLKPQSAVLKNVSITLNVKVKRTEVMVKNVIGYLDGKGPLEDETIVVGAHYDHLGYGGAGSLAPLMKNKIHFGADDNGSGTTSVMELARRFGAKKDRDGRRLVFMTFTAEERGLIGSRHYCRIEPLFPLKNTAAMFNLDMVGRINPRIIGVDDKSVTVGDDDGKNPRVYDLAEDCKFFQQVKGTREPLKNGATADVFKKIPAKGLIARLTVVAATKVTEITLLDEPTLLALGLDSGKGFDELVKKHNTGFNIVKDGSVFGASDHYSFFQQRIPVLFFWTGTHPEYHRPTDTPERINVPGMKRVADYSEKIIDELRGNPKRYEYVEMKSTFKMGPFPKMGIQPDYMFGGKGVLIDVVTPGGPAATAGIKKGDIIIEIAGKAVPNVNGYMSILQTQKPGVTIEVRLLRDSKEVQLKVTPK